MTGLLNQQQGLLSSYTPSARERMVDWLARNWYGDSREGTRKAEKLMGVADMTPVGMATGLYDAGRDIGQGNYMAGGLGVGLAALPLPGKFKHEVGAYLRDAKPGALNGLTKAQNRTRNQASDTGNWIDAELPIHNIYGTQTQLNPDFMDVPKNNSAPPFVVKVDGKYYAQDGHHRLAAQAAEGKQTAKVRLVDLDGTTDQSTPLLDWQPKKSIRAYHGSPHDFDKFSMDKIGTGEGAQAYGHGLYFAENEGVAREYREAVSRMHRNSAVDMAKVPQPTWTGEEALRMSDLAQRARKKNSNLTAEESAQLRDFTARQKAYNDAVDAAKPDIPGKMYEVEINADPDSFLDWDKPLSEQPTFIDHLRKSRSPKVREIANDPKLLENMQSYGRDLGPMTGKELYNRISLMASGKVVGKEATPYLAKAGIPGIKYLDAGSRASSGGSRNYVVFDENLVNIIRKYGIAGLLGAGGMQGLLGGIPQEQPQGLLGGGA